LTSKSLLPVVLLFVATTKPLLAYNSQMVTTELFSKLIPLKTLSQADREQLAKVASVLTYTVGQTVFGKGEMARTQAYLLEGELQLRGDEREINLAAGSEAARFPIAPGTRRNVSAICRQAARVLFVDAELLDLLLTWSGTGGVDIEQGTNNDHSQTDHDAVLDDSHDWMTALLQSKAFLRVPPANIAEIFANMEAVSFHPGEAILEINTPGDYYYIVTHGRVQVYLPDIDGMGEEELAQLGVGKGFGEEALVSGAPRNASVRAISRCVLMRLSSNAFARLLRAPLLPEIQFSELHTESAHKHLLIDVRSPAEFDQQHLPDAINLPLSRIRESAKSLNPNSEYWVYCDTGRRSASATFLLNQSGIHAKHLKGAAL
jgi:rhodanese-related sulfurtransferase